MGMWGNVPQKVVRVSTRARCCTTVGQTSDVGEVPVEPVVHCERYLRPEGLILDELVASWEATVPC